MPITIDLGGAPANEDCAQLGHTPNFASVNRFEVLAYRAAVIAVHGTPPAGCRLATIDNRHDFGAYITLALVIADDAHLALARDYAHRVEDGPASWLEAGMAPPITYDDAEAIFEKDDVAGVVLGALMTTRPDDRGRFPIPAFATLHGNLTAAFPEIAARFRQLQTQGELA